MGLLEQLVNPRELADVLEVQVESGLPESASESVIGIGKFTDSLFPRDFSKIAWKIGNESMPLN